MNNCTILVILFYPWRYLIVFWWLLNQITWNKLQSGNLNRNLSNKAGRDACPHVSFAKEFSFIYLLWFPLPLFKVLPCNFAQTSAKWGQRKGICLPTGDQAGLPGASIHIGNRKALFSYPQHHAFPCPPCARLMCRAALSARMGWHTKTGDKDISLFWSLKKSTDKSSYTALLWTSPCLHLKPLLVIRCWEKEKSTD